MSTQDIFDMADTWDDAGTTYTSIKMDVTKTAAAAGSGFFDMLLNGVSKFRIGQGGGIVQALEAGVVALAMTGFSLTGSQASSVIDLAGTWNTTGTPAAIKLDITDTASNASSRLLSLLLGGAAKFGIGKNGDILSTPSANTSALAVTGFSLTGSNAQSVIDLAATWNTTGTPTAIKLNITDTASNASSLLLDLQIGGSPVFRVAKDSRISIGGTDLHLIRDAANSLAQRNSTNAQAFRVYNTFTDASNYERGAMRWTSNVFEIGTAIAGTGAPRAVRIEAAGAHNILFRTNGSDRWSFNAAGHFIPSIDNAQDFGGTTLRSRNGFFSGYLGIGDGVTAPSAVAGTAYIYVDTADGDLKVRFGDGTTKTIVTDT